MIVLSVNAGSSSLKFQAFDMPEENVLISGTFERIGMKESFYTIKVNGEKIKKEVELKNHEKAFEILMEELLENKVVEKLDEITGVGHRVVQGGEFFQDSCLVDEAVVEKISKKNPVVLIENDSVIAVGGTLIEAFDALEVVEFTANTLIHGGLIGQIVKITDEEVEVINKAFNLD